MQNKCVSGSSVVILLQIEKNDPSEIVIVACSVKLLRGMEINISILKVKYGKKMFCK